MEKNTDLFLVIDMQNVYTKGQEWACEGVVSATSAILRVLNADVCPNVLFTRYLAPEYPVGIWKEYNKVNAKVNADPFANEMIADFLPWTEKYPLLTKSVYSSFAIPEVKEMAHHARNVVISGVVAECCVLSTVLSAIDEGCKVIYLTDGVAGLSQESRQEAEKIVSYFAPLHTELMTADEYIEKCKCQKESESAI